MSAEERPSQRPSLRLNLSKAPKRRRYTEVDLPPHTAAASNLAALHQQTSLSIAYDAEIGLAPQWHMRGSTTLYLIDPTSSTNTTSSLHQLALHLRASAIVQHVKIQSLTPRADGLEPLRTSYHHADPLEHVLVRPPATYEVSEEDEALGCNYRWDADAQSSRGAAGFTTSLRAASMASNLGELRISVERPAPLVAKLSADEAKSRATAVWKADLVSSWRTSGTVEAQVQAELRQRSTGRREKRIEHMAARLAVASTKQAAFKVTIEYRIRQAHGHLGGLHAMLPGDLLPPHLYTTAGVYGDHEGPRSWLPTLDSASTSHRATHEWTVRLTAPLRQGLSIVGAGEDFGASMVLLHQVGLMGVDEEAKRELGAEHVNMLQSIRAQRQSREPGASHVIPPETSTTTSMDAIQATVVWSSASWTPIPARSLGFAIGPFKVWEDPEYFGPVAVAAEEEEVEDEDEDEDEDMLSPAERHEAFLEAARRNGEGIRQVYFAPLFARKYIHASADQRFLPDTTIRLQTMIPRHKETAKKLGETINCATVGVPHRALSLMRDVLALPTFRTAAYTQIWIPGAVHGGVTSGAFHCCPEVMLNPFLGGAIIDARLLPPIGCRLPFYQGGRVLQFVQARSAIRSWITAALPLGGLDDVGNGYIHTLTESFVMSLYERGHGAHGEGGAKGGVFFSKRYSSASGVNSANLDFLPVQNIEEMDTVIGGVRAVPIEERNTEQLWRSAINGSESHTAALDEFNVGQLIYRDAVEALERGTDKDKAVPMPSMGWFGSHLSLTYLSSNATSSTDLGCGAVEMLHPVGGLSYRTLKSEVFRGVVESRAGVANFIRLLRAAFIAAHLDDIGETELRLPARREKKAEKDAAAASTPAPTERSESLRKPPFVVCVNEILKKKGLTHTLFTRALQNVSGPLKEALLLGTLVDVERHAEDPRTRRPFVDPEGFPNSYVRGSSLLYCRVGVQVEVARDATSSQAATKGIQMQAYAEPIIPEGGVAYGGPITMRVVENEGQFREYVKDLNADGSRRDWGATFLHAKPVTSVKAQTAASGTVESAAKDKAIGRVLGPNTPSLDTRAAMRPFTEECFHTGGYQAIELIRLTNLTPLLWVRVDPAGIYSGRISVFQPDACLAECLYHDGDAAAQVEAMRMLAERPLRIQATTKVNTIYDVNVSELPVRVLGDCLRGSPALHSSLPHTPVVRSQAALAIAQWQNNKAPQSKDAVGLDNWVGVTLLMQYFRERFYSNGVVMPVKFSRLALKVNEAQAAQAAASTEGGGAANPRHDDKYQYLDSLEEGEERAGALDDAEEVEMEEDEEYRVRSAVVTAIASIRAKDGQTPPMVIRFLETVLESEDAEMIGHLVYPDEELMAEKNFRQMKAAGNGDGSDSDVDVQLTPSLSFVSSALVADALLALCYVNAAPSMFVDPATGKLIQTSGSHPVSRLMKVAHGWLEWELYREKVRFELEAETRTGISGNCHNIIAACAIVGLSCLAILKQSTTDPSTEVPKSDNMAAGENLDRVATSKFYMDIFDSRPRRNDLTRAACAQAVACICCAADRFEEETASSLGLLTTLEFLLDRILESETSPGLRQTMALIMMDACTGKVCSLQRVGSTGGRNHLASSVTRYLNGPLGASHGGDNGSALLISVSSGSFPAASAVNDGARRGLRLLSRAGHPKETIDEKTIVRVARFATRLWRTLNGEPADAPDSDSGGRLNGICAFDGALRSSLLALWQWIWPKGCFAVLQVQAWKEQENAQKYLELGAHLVMKISEEEKAAATAEENALADINRLVNAELDRQAWRGEMVQKAYDMYKASKGPIQDVAAAEQGIGQPLPPIQRDTAFKQGGWIASAAQQRRALALDGGTAVTKLRLTVKNTGDV